MVRTWATTVAAAATLLAWTVAAAAAPLDSLAWMAGVWAGEADGVRSEEHWSTPHGGLMIGMHRDVRAGRATFFEFLRIEQRGDTLAYVAMPRGRNETVFVLREIGKERVVFENSAHDYPQRIHYWREPSGALGARVEGTVNGRLRSESWTWKPVR